MDNENILITSKHYADHINFWTKNFDRLEEKFRIKGTRTVKPDKNLNKYESHPVYLSYDSCNNIRAISRESDFEIFVSITSALFLTLARYTQNDSVIIDSPALRKGSSGPFSQPIVPFIKRLDWQNSIKDFVLGVNEILTQTYKYQEIPLDKVIGEASSTERTNVLITYDQLHQFFTTPEHYDLHLVIRRLPQDSRLVEIRIIYNTAHFEDWFVAQLGSHLDHFLSQFKYFDRPIAELELLTEAEKQQVYAHNQTAYWESRTLLVHRLFEDQVRRNPDATAVVYGQASYTYEQLNVISNKVAWYLRNTHGLQQNEVVSIMLGKSPWIVICMLGVLKAGGAYTPIDPSYPATRIKYLIEDSGTQLLLTHSENLMDLEFYEGELCAVDIQFESLVEMEHNLETEISETDLAYLIYTSGSTGKPKGVPIRHQSIANTLLWRKTYYHFGESSVNLQIPSISFDSSVEDIFSVLISGGTLVIPMDNSDPQTLARLIERHAVTHVLMVPSLYAAVLPELPETSLALIAVTLAGEELKRDLVLSHFDHLPDVSLFNEYGPTENAVCSTAGKVEVTDTVVSIGKPISNANVYILNTNMDVLPPGVAGEIYLSGTGLCDGYWHAEGLTKQKFVRHALPLIGQQNLYKTGDLARWMPDGNIQFLGRIDEQIKIRGQRIEPGEIENVLIKSDAVDEVAVGIRETTPGEVQLIAYVVSADACDPVAIRGFLENHLPQFMIPTVFVNVEALPLNLNGKIDRKALADIKLELPEERAAYVLPSSPLEEQIAEIWQEVLNKPEIGIEDNFFSLGGHSLKAINIISRINRLLQVKIEIGDIFSHNTVKSLAEFIAHEEQVSYVPIESLEQKPYYALSQGQQRLWVLQQLDEDQIAYNIPAAYTLFGKLDLDAFQYAFSNLVARHESLRTTFVLVDGEPKQIVHDSSNESIVIQYQDLRKEEQPEDQLNAIVHSETGYIFDLETGPLMRAKLFQMDEKKYVFLFNMHHIITDGWSMEILTKEIFQLYNAHVQGKQNPLLPLRIQYKDFAAWQNKELTSSAMRQRQRYWHQQFESPIPVIDLPLDFPRPRIQTYHGANMHGVIGREIGQAVTDLSQRQGSSLFITLLTAVKVLLHRYTGQEDLVIRTPLAGREFEGLENILGFFVNTLAIRTVFSKKDSFSEVLDKVKVSTLGAFQNGSYPFDHLVDDLNLERDLGRSPLFDIMVILEDEEAIGTGSIPMKGILVTPYPIASEVSKFDLTFTFSNRSDDGLRLVLNYNTDIFARESIAQMIDHLREILQVAGRNSSLPLQSIEFIPSEERKLLSTCFNSTNKIPTLNTTIHSFFEQQVIKTPHAPALVFGEIEFTYHELNKKVNKLAHYLRNVHNVQAESLIGVMVERSEWMVVVLLGILKSGAAYVPIDTSYPPDRVNFILEDTGLTLLFTEESLDLEINQEDIIAMPRNITEKAIASYDGDNPVSESQRNHLAYLIYTSGSTGRPKGVRIAHGNTASFLTWANEEFENSDFSIVFSVTSYCFDLSIFELFYTLSTGKCVRVLPLATDIVHYLGSDKDILINTVPSVVDNLLAANANFTNVRVINLAGEPIPLRVKEQLDCDKIEVRNLYGPSEDTTYSTCFRLQSGDVTIPIGKPITNTQAYILDEDMQLMPLGARGELCLGGDGIAMGYWQRPQLTESQFVNNPFQQGERLYRTGDLARWRPDGNLEFLGRKDQQVKIRGYRIELGEVETQLNRHPMLKQAIVVDYTNALGDKSLVAYYVSDEPVDHQLLNNYLSALLPVYMVPAYWQKLEKMPLNPNGKLDRKRLPSPIQTDASTSYTAPKTPVQQKLVSIWQKILDRKQVGIDDNFFVYGGNSLRAIQMTAHIHKEFQARINIKNVFLNPTIRDLSIVIQDASEELYEPIVAVPHQLHYVLSQAQKRLWIAERLSQSLHSSNMFEGYLFEGNLDYQALNDSFRLLVLRHESLRTTFTVIADQPRQKVNEVHTVATDLVQLDYRTLADPLKSCKTLASEIIATGFDLETGPLFRAYLVQLADDRHAFLFCIHHIVSDAWSNRILTKELIQHYNSIKNGSLPVLGSLKIQYKDFAAWEQNLLSSPLAHVHKDYWLNQFKGQIPVLHLPTDFSRAQSKSFKGSSIQIGLGKEQLLKIEDLCNKQGTTIFMMLVAATTALLYRYSGQEDIVIGTPVAGRVHSDLENQVGLYLNNLALRVKFNADSSFLDLLKDVQSCVLDAFEHQIYPYNQLVEDLKIKRDNSRFPLFDVVVVLDNVLISGASELELGGIIATPFSLDSQSSTVDLRIVFNQAKEGLLIFIEYKSDLFLAETVLRMGQNLVVILEQIISDPTTNIYEIEVGNLETKPADQ